MIVIRNLNPHSRTGGPLHRLVADECLNIDNAIKVLDSEFKELDTLDDVYLSLNFPAGRDGRGVAYDTYFSFAHFSRNQTLRAIAALLRHEVSDAFSCSRAAAESAFFALLMSHGRLTEEKYLNDHPYRTGLWRRLNDDVRKDRCTPQGVEALLKIQKLHSAMGSHADAPTVGSRLRLEANGLTRTSFFEDVSDERLIDLYLGILWVGGICAETFCLIAEARHIDMARARHLLDHWKSNVQPKMASRGLLEDPSNIRST